MALRSIRRHLKDCPHTSTRYRRCRCPIHVYGTLGGHTIRRALDQTSWDAATETINGWTASGEIGVVKAEAPPIRDAIAEFLADCEARHLGWEAKRKYRHLLEDRLTYRSPGSGSETPARLRRSSPGPPLGVGDGHLVAVLAAVAVNALLLVGLTQYVAAKRFRVAWDTGAIAVVYACAMWLMYTVRA